MIARISTSCGLSGIPYIFFKETYEYCFVVPAKNESDFRIRSNFISIAAQKFSSPTLYILVLNGRGTNNSHYCGIDRIADFRAEDRRLFVLIVDATRDPQINNIGDARNLGVRFAMSFNYCKNAVYISTDADSEFEKSYIGAIQGIQSDFFPNQCGFSAPIWFVPELLGEESVEIYNRTMVMAECDSRLSEIEAFYLDEDGDRLVIMVGANMGVLGFREILTTVQFRSVFGEEDVLFSEDLMRRTQIFEVEDALVFTATRISERTNSDVSTGHEIERLVNRDVDLFMQDLGERYRRLLESILCLDAGCASILKQVVLRYTELTLREVDILSQIRLLYTYFIFHERRYFSARFIRYGLLHNVPACFNLSYFYDKHHYAKEEIYRDSLRAWDELSVYF